MVSFGEWADPFRRVLIRARYTARELHMRDATTVTLGMVVSQSIMLLSLPVLTRVYDPASFGSYALVSSLSAVFVLIYTLNLSGVIPTTPSIVSASRFTSALLFFALALTSVFLIATSLFFASGILTAQSDPHLQLILSAGILNGLSFALFLTFQGLLTRIGRFLAIARGVTVRSVGFVAIAVMFGWWTRGAPGNGYGLILATIIGDLLGTTALLSALSPRQRRIIAPLRFRRVLAETGRRRSLLAAAAVSHPLNLILAHAPLWIIMAQYGAQASGWFALATRIVVAPTTMIGTSVGSVLSRQISLRYHQGRAIDHLVLSAVGAMTIAGSAGFALLAGAAALGTGTAFGPAWEQASESIVLLCVLGFFVFVESSVGFLPILLGVPGFLALWSSMRALLLATIALWPANPPLTYPEFVGWYVAAESAAHLIFIAFVMHRSHAVAGAHCAPPVRAHDLPRS